MKPMHTQTQQEEGIKLSSITEGETAYGLVEFEVDLNQMERERNTAYTFVAPFARLVRSMRRCDRRHLPLLKDWGSVDVVMTQFELVYFESIDNYYPDADEETKLHAEACRSALKATKGGKNLRLCDVALGRKVVGHLDFADVTEIHVAKDDVPVSDLSLVEKAAALFNKEQDYNVEHWSNVQMESEFSRKYARLIRWKLMKEERLKISTHSGTLIFRFYSDLARFEAEKFEKGTQISDNITRDIAFQWAETISHICGRDQLEQSLPHFGEDNEDELRDYLEVDHFHETELENEKKRIGATSIGTLERLLHVNDFSAPGSVPHNTNTKDNQYPPAKSSVDFGWDSNPHYNPNRQRSGSDSLV